VLDSIFCAITGSTLGRDCSGRTALSRRYIPRLANPALVFSTPHLIPHACNNLDIYMVTGRFLKPTVLAAPFNLVNPTPRPRWDARSSTAHMVIMDDLLPAAPAGLRSFIVDEEARLRFVNMRGLGTYLTLDENLLRQTTWSAQRWGSDNIRLLEGVNGALNAAVDNLWSYDGESKVVGGVTTAKQFCTSWWPRGNGTVNFLPVLVAAAGAPTGRQQLTEYVTRMPVGVATQLYTPISTQALDIWSLGAGPSSPWAAFNATSAAVGPAAMAPVQTSALMDMAGATSLGMASPPAALVMARLDGSGLSATHAAGAGGSMATAGSTVPAVETINQNSL